MPIALSVLPQPMGARMDRDVFYQKLVGALQHQGFRLEAGDSSQDGVAAERDAGLSAIRNVASAVMPVHPVFDHDTVRGHLDMVRTWARVVCVRYVLGQPVIAAVVEADRLAHEEMIALARRFDKVVVDTLDVTAIIGKSINVGKLRLGGVKLGSTGILLFVFFDPEAASRFAARTRRKCKIWHFWKKTWVLPWQVDVANKTVTRHHGLPYLMSLVLNWDNLRNEIFR
jgi:hypothetical protein